MKAEEAKANDPAIRLQHRAEKAHTVVRNGDGRIIAAIYRDGQALMTNELAAMLGGVAGWKALTERTAGMPEAARRNAIADAIERAYGDRTVRFERYGESGLAPTRGEVEDEFNGANLKERRAMGLT